MELIKNIPHHFWHVLGEMSPYLLFGFLMAGILHVFVPQDLIARHLGGKGILSLLKATIFGIPLPLCSCSVIPVAASLRKNGASREATTSFLIATPETGVDSILVTFSLLGPVFGIFRPLVALVNGVVGGLLVGIFAKGDITDVPTDTACHQSCCETTPAQTKKANPIIRGLRYGFHVLPSDLSKPLFIGLLIAAGISSIVPDDFFHRILGGGGILGMLVMMAVGIPLYVCATASVPIAASLIMKGISPGAALVFLMTGPATNAATLAVIWKMMGKRTAWIYLATIALIALGSGFLLDLIFNIQGTHPHSIQHEMLPPWFRTLCSITLIALLARHVIKFPVREKPITTSEKIEKMDLLIQGATCQHCFDTITGSIREMKGVTSAKMSKNILTVFGESLDFDAIKTKIESLGYKAEKHVEHG